jgi:hypothetical protein
MASQGPVGGIAGVALGQGWVSWGTQLTGTDSRTIASAGSYANLGHLSLNQTSVLPILSDGEIREGKDFIQGSTAQSPLPAHLHL